GCCVWPGSDGRFHAAGWNVWCSLFGLCLGRGMEVGSGLRNRFFGFLAEGGVPLPPLPHDRRIEVATTANFDFVAEPIGTGGLAHKAAVKLFLSLLEPCEQLARAVDGNRFLITSNKQRQRTAAQPAVVV